MIVFGPEHDLLFKSSSAYCVIASLFKHMQRKFEINRTNSKGSCRLGRKVVNHNSKSDLPLKNVKRPWNIVGVNLKHAI